MTSHTLGIMLAALSTSDKAAFLAKCTPEFAKTAALQFDAVAGSLAAHFKAGYTLKHLTELKRRDGWNSVFKIEFSDGADDVLAVISEKDGLVAGLLLK